MSLANRNTVGDQLDSAIAGKDLFIVGLSFARKSEGTRWFKYDRDKL